MLTFEMFNKFPMVRNGTQKSQKISKLSRLSAATAVLVVAFDCFLLAEAFYERERFKAIVFNDHSNDDAINMNTQELIKRSGFNYQLHYVIADDGYVTQLNRLVNPLADPAKLKSPPVLLFHGGNIDNSCYLLASSIQHHPEKYPRSESDGPITSSNRSLAFMLANNGYDVWLVSTRGSNEDNQAFVEPENVERLRQEPNWTPDESNFELVKTNPDKYWSYGLDDIIKNELRVQFDKVSELTGSNEVSIFSFSLSTPTTMVFLAINPDYAKRVRVYTQMAPSVASDHFALVPYLYFEKICPYLPTRGIGFTPTYTVKPVVSRAVLEISRVDTVKYSLVYSVLTALFGPSLKYHTNLELNLLARVFRPVSFKSVQQYCKDSVSKQLTKFDYGPAKNFLEYGQFQPPVYNVSRIEVQNWLILAGTYDALADPTTVQRLIETTTSPRPVKLIVALGFNHVDFIGAVENDKYVNFPYLAELDKHSDGVQSSG